MRIARLAVAGVLLAGVSGMAAARDNVHFSISLGVPAPVYVAPAPAYYPPAPAYYPPASSYYVPAPTYYPPVTSVYYSAPVYTPYVRVAPAVVAVRPGNGHGHWKHWR